MTKNLYTHFTYEHLYGHHRKVSTPDDPASAEQDITVLRFALRSIKGSWLSVYNMEIEEGKKVYENYAVLSILCSIACTGLVYFASGAAATIFFLVQGIGSIFFLEIINYI